LSTATSEYFIPSGRNLSAFTLYIFISIINLPSICLLSNRGHFITYGVVYPIFKPFYKSDRNEYRNISAPYILCLISSSFFDRFKPCKNLVSYLFLACSRISFQIAINNCFHAILENLVMLAF